jgi:hypothetical protein
LRYNTVENVGGALAAESIAKRRHPFSIVLLKKILLREVQVGPAILVQMAKVMVWEFMLQATQSLIIVPS